MLPVALAVAIAFLKREEGCYLHAYPDPLSPLGKAIGARGIEHMGKTGRYPREDLERISGEPWTIGWGTTGIGIKQGTQWSQAQCDAALTERAQLAHNEASLVWPGMHLLHANAQAALISIAYNRGTTKSMRGDRGREMRAIADQVRALDYPGIAASIRGMKRLWPGTGLVGRREREAGLVERGK